MEYEIDPVKGTLMGLAPQDQNAWEMSNKCYAICASYNQGNDDQSLAPAFERNGIVSVAPLIPNVWNSTEKCSARCDQLLNKQKILQFGEGDCNHQAPMPPVVWKPRHFPPLLKKLGDKEQALVTCNEMCKNTNEPEQCKMNCRDDYNSLIPKKSSAGDIQLDVVSIEEQDSSKDDSVASLAGYSLILLGAVLFSYLVIRSRRKK